MADQYAPAPQQHRGYLYQHIEHAGGSSAAPEQEPARPEPAVRHLPTLPPIYSALGNLPSFGGPSTSHQQIPASPSLSQGTSPVSSSPKAVSSGKSFQCTGYEGCSMSFSRSEHLARHVRKHTGEKPFPCRCGKKFTRLDNLRQHASTIHADEAEANEELFTRLAAHMPRSGQRARRQSVQIKPTPESPILPSPSVLQNNFPPLPQPLPGSSAYPPTNSNESYRYFPTSPLSASSATFRFLPTTTSPVHTFPASAYEGYASQSSPQGWSQTAQPLIQSRQSASQPSSPKRFTNTTTTLSPVPAIGGGSHFRSYAGSTAVLEPTRVEFTRTAFGRPSGYLSYLPVTNSSSATSPAGGDLSRPVLPSLSALIADAPAITFPTASFAKHRPHQRTPAPLQGLSSAAQLDKALLVAVELAIGSPASSTRESFEGAQVHLSSGRSFSFSSDVSVESLGYLSSSPSSVAVPSPPALTVDSFSPSNYPSKACPQRCPLDLYRQQMYQS